MISRIVVVSAALLGVMATAQDVSPTAIEQTQPGLLRGTSSFSPVKAASTALQPTSSSTTNTTAALLTGTQEAAKISGDFYASGDSGLHPENFHPGAGNRFSLSVRPNQEAVRVSSSKYYAGGRFEFRCRTASQMPGIITAVYMSSGNGRTGDSNNGNQDEIDWEWKGNTPDQVQTNIYVGGQDASQVTYLGFNSAESEATYGIEWGPSSVQFFVNGGLVRTLGLSRPLQPMQLQLAVWTTTGGWSGLIGWAGATNWGSRGDAPITAEFELISVPN